MSCRHENSVMEQNNNNKTISILLFHNRIFMTATHLQHIVHPASIGPNDKDPYNISNTSSSSNSSSPEPISSSTEGGVPNPFTMTAQTIANSGTTSMTVVHWGQQQQLQQQEQLNTAPVPLQTTSNSFASTNISGAMIEIGRAHV